MAITFSSNYNGDNIAQILEAMVIGNQAQEKGSVNLFTDHHQNVHLPRLKASGNVLEDPVETPSTPADAFTYDERTITTNDMMFFDLVNPRTFENAWRDFQPTGDLVDALFDSDVQAALIRETVKSVSNQLGNVIWAGDTSLGGSDPLRFFDGYVTLLDADADTVKPTPAGVITEGNVISILELVHQSIPDQVYDDPNMVIHMNTADFRLFQSAARALDFKGAEIADAQASRYGGFEIRHYTGLPKDRIVAAVATSGNDSNLHAATYLENDPNNVKFERYRPESELFIVKVLFRYGVQIGFPEETVLYKDA